MSNKIRECVRQIEKEKDVEKLLPEYVKQYMILHDGYARIKMMMEYYMFYETVSEGINPYLDTVKDIAEPLHRKIDEFYSQNQDMEQKKQMAEEILSLREEVVDRMQVLTAYVDCFVVYEYILNRVQYRFEDMELLPSDSVFAKDLVNYIFSSQDNATISDNIRFAVGQLPMRMTRSHYFDLIRDSISLYKGGDVSSLESFLYMFRTNAMLYKDKNQQKYFTEFKDVLDELADLDYENITKEVYEIYAEKIRVNASKLNDVADLYMQMGSLLNELYAMCSAAEYVESEDAIPESDLVIRGINALFLGKESEIWEQIGVKETDSEEDKLYALGEKFVAIEGKQERIYDSLNTAGAALDSIMEGQEDDVRKAGLQKEFATLKKLFLLTSSSVFADLAEEKTQEKVTEEMAEQAAATLILECKELFSGKSRMLRRAVMANTLEKMPVFFQSAEEVANYVTSALSGCDDEAEKYASKQLLLEVFTV